MSDALTWISINSRRKIPKSAAKIHFTMLYGNDPYFFIKNFSQKFSPCSVFGRRALGTKKYVIKASRCKIDNWFIHNLFAQTDVPNYFNVFPRKKIAHIKCFLFLYNFVFNSYHRFLLCSPLEIINNCSCLQSSFHVTVKRKKDPSVPTVAKSLGGRSVAALWIGKGGENGSQ